MTLQPEIDISRHQPLIKAITGFYQLLAKTCYIQPSDILHPPHGRLFNPSLGLQADFSQEAVAVLSKLPYLSEECSNIQLDGGSTNPLSYLTNPEPEEDGMLSWGCWEDSRDPTSLAEDGGQMLPLHMFSITQGNLYGSWLIYDLNSCTLRSWSTIEGDVDESADIEKLPALPPAEMLERWAAKYRKQEIMVVDFYGEVFKPETPEDLTPEAANLVMEWSKEVEASFGIGKEEYSVDRGLSRIYRECGWNGADGGNEVWNREEFVERRQKWFEGVYEGRDDRRSENQQIVQNSRTVSRLEFRALHCPPSTTWPGPGHEDRN